MLKRINIVLVVLILFGVCYAAVTKLTKVALTNSTVDSTTIGATTPSTGVFSTLSATTASATNMSATNMDTTVIGATTPANGTFTNLKVNTGVTNTGAGFKHVRQTSCLTPASTSGFCNTTVTWPGTAFADTSYTYGCSGDGNGQATFTTTASASKGTTSIVAVVQNTPGNSASVSVVLNCWAFHD